MKILRLSIKLLTYYTVENILLVLYNLVWNLISYFPKKKDTNLNRKKFNYDTKKNVGIFEQFHA